MSKRPVSVRLDKYGAFDLGRQCELSAWERWLLVALCLAADWRDHCLSTTYSELSEWTGLSRNRIPTVLNRLEDCGLVSIRKSFGPNHDGRIKILAWDKMIVPNVQRSSGPKGGHGTNFDGVSNETES